MSEETEVEAPEVPKSIGDALMEWGWPESPLVTGARERPVDSWTEVGWAENMVTLDVPPEVVVANPTFETIQALHEFRNSLPAVPREHMEGVGYSGRTIHQVKDSIIGAMRRFDTPIYVSPHWSTSAVVPYGKVGKKLSRQVLASTVMVVRFYGPDGSWVTAVGQGNGIGMRQEALSIAESYAFKGALQNALMLADDEWEPELQGTDINADMEEGYEDEEYDSSERDAVIAELKELDAEARDAVIEWGQEYTTDDGLQLFSEDRRLLPVLDGSSVESLRAKINEMTEG